AHDRNRRVSESLQAGKPHHREQRAHVQTRSGRIEADIGGHFLGGDERSEAFRLVVDHPPPHQLVAKRHPPEFDFLYQSMSITRRAVLKTLVGAGAAVVTAGGAYGFFDERHALGLTEVVLPVSHLPAGLAGLKIGLLTDVHRSDWVSADDVDRGVQLLMAA